MTDNTLLDNPVTNAGVTLGRVLFYDVKLSANDTTACASCHEQANGFANTTALSVGFEGGLTGRNSMGLTNARFYELGTFFWDERAATLEDQVLMPIQDSVEMGMDLDALEIKLASVDYYPDLSTAAFGDGTITSARIARALAQFVRTIVSYQSKYDQGIANDFTNFTAQELQGMEIFISPPAACPACHQTDIQVADTPFNIGLDATTVDLGLAGIMGLSEDEGKFKTPSLRNIGLTAPYMHDGRFATLEEVVAFYNLGVQVHPNLDERLENPQGNPRRLNLSGDEIQALVAFLETLTDEVLIADVKFSDPFREVFDIIAQIFLLIGLNE